MLNDVSGPYSRSVESSSVIMMMLSWWLGLQVVVVVVVVVVVPMVSDHGNPISCGTCFALRLNFLAGVAASSASFGVVDLVSIAEVVSWEKSEIDSRPIRCAVATDEFGCLPCRGSL